MDGGDNNGIFDLKTEDAILDHEMMDQLSRDDRDLMDLISGNTWMADETGDEASQAQSGIGDRHASQLHETVGGQLEEDWGEQGEGKPQAKAEPQTTNEMPFVPNLQQAAIDATTAQLLQAQIGGVQNYNNNVDIPAMVAQMWQLGLVPPLAAAPQGQPNMEGHNQMNAVLEQQVIIYELDRDKIAEMSSSATYPQSIMNQY